MYNEKHTAKPKTRQVVTKIGYVQTIAEKY